MCKNLSLDAQQTKKSESFSMSALLRDDQPKISKSPASSNNSFENIRLVVVNQTVLIYSRMTLLLSINFHSQYFLSQNSYVDHHIHIFMNRTYYRGLCFIHFHYLPCCNSKDNNNSKIHHYQGK